MRLDKNLDFKEYSTPAIRAGIWLLKFLLASVSLSIAYYLLFALLVNTDTEQRLVDQNREYTEQYSRLQERADLLDDAVASLQMKDNSIYHDIFDTDAPENDPSARTGYVDVADSLDEPATIRYIAARADEVQEHIEEISRNLQRILDAANAEGFAAPPMRVPVQQLSYSQIGASMGKKINPYFKVPAEHMGVDIIASQGTAVLATADGTVSLVKRSSKGEGNVIEITHKGGYKTRYCHLGEMSVPQGKVVKAGSKIASVGMSGSSYVPHLHYEVLRGEEHIDPVSCFFESVSSSEYTNMLFMAATTQQSLD